MNATDTLQKLYEYKNTLETQKRLLKDDEHPKMAVVLISKLGNREEPIYVNLDDVATIKEMLLRRRIQYISETDKKISDELLVLLRNLK